MWYLKDCELDIKVISQKKFEFYTPITGKSEKQQDYMVLDSVTIENLKLLGGAGSLMKTLDFCSTASGRRLLQSWICRPYCDADKIKDRQDAVKELLSDPATLEKVRTEVLAKLPDLERQVSKYVLLLLQKNTLQKHFTFSNIFYMLSLLEFTYSVIDFVLNTTRIAARFCTRCRRTPNVKYSISWARWRGSNWRKTSLVYLKTAIQDYFGK